MIKLASRKKKSLLFALSAMLLLLSSFFMYDFYKCLSAFIANGFREGGVMLPMILSYFLPVFCFFLFVYRALVARMARGLDAAFCVLVILYAVLCLVFIFRSLPLYASNSRLGVYDALPGLPFPFPYDALVLHFTLILWNLLRLGALLMPSRPFASALDATKARGSLSLRAAEYLALCVLAVAVLVFTGAGVTGLFTSLRNTLYDARYLFLLLWVTLLPLANLLWLVLKPERRLPTRRARIASLLAGIGTNVAVTLLLLLLTRTRPDFMVAIGKPLFLIAFSVSLPIEMAVLLGITALGTLLLAYKLFRLLIAK